MRDRRLHRTMEFSWQSSESAQTATIDHDVGDEHEYDSFVWDIGDVVLQPCADGLPDAATQQDVD